MKFHFVKTIVSIILPILCSLFLLGDTPEEFGKDIHQKLYVLNSGGGDITVIDVATNKILRTIRVGTLPHGVATTKAHDVLYISVERENALTIVDPVKDKVMKRYEFFGKRPNEIEVTSDGRFVYMPAFSDGKYEVFDTNNEEIIQRISVDGNPHNVVVSHDDKYMYLSPVDRGRISIEEAKAQGWGPTSLNKKIYVVETATHTIVDTIHTGNTPRPITINSDGTRLYVNTDNLLGFLVIDLEKRKVVHTAKYELTLEEKQVPSQSHGIVITPDDSQVWSTDVAHGVVHVFDVTKEPPEQIARIKGGKERLTPYWLAVTPDGKTVYAANTADSTISVLDVTTLKEVARIKLGQSKSPKRMLVLNVPIR